MNAPQREETTMNDNRMQATILELANRCVRCGRSDCRSAAHFRAALAQHEAPPVLLPEAANSLARLLAARRGWSQDRAWRWIRSAFTVPA
jgi:hypothetical protein